MMLQPGMESPMLSAVGTEPSLLERSAAATRHVDQQMDHQMDQHHYQDQVNCVLQMVYIVFSSSVV